MASLEFESTLPQIDEEILEYSRLLASSPRSDPHRRDLLLHLELRRNTRFSSSLQKGDLDKAITHLTEAVLLPLPPSRTVVLAFYCLASVLLSRFVWFKQPEDVKSSADYFRFIRIHFHPLEAFDISRGELASRLVCALAKNAMLGSGDTVQDMEEIMAIIPDVLEFLTSDVSPPEDPDMASEAIGTFAAAIINTEVFQREDTQQLADRGVQMIREATMLKPDSHSVSYALASCLAARFEMVHVISDYEDAMAIADKIVATLSPGDSLTQAQNDSIILIRELLVSRLNSSSKLEYLEDAILRIRTLLCLPSLLDQVRTYLANTLEAYLKQRSSYFGVAEDLGDGFGPMFNLIPAPSNWGLDPTSQIVEKLSFLQEVHAGIRTGEITDTEAAVELSRNMLPLQQSGHRLSFLPASLFAQILFDAFLLTERSDYLDEAITTFRDLHKASASKGLHFNVGYKLLMSLILRCRQSGSPQDFEESMQLSLRLAYDESREVFARFNIACGWARMARAFGSPMVCLAYETALSLLQETLVFTPTLKTQHSNLAVVFKEAGVLPSDYASYQIERGQPKEAIETLERGRALLWSEMRGFRTSIDQLRAADPAIADQFADINQRLESVTMSVAQSESEEIGGSGIGIMGRSDEVDSIGRLVTMQRRLLKERETLVSHIQSLPGLEDFLKPLPFDVLNSAAAYGPVIIINLARPEFHHFFPSSILLLLRDSSPSVISTPSDFHERANRLQNELLRVRKEKGPGSKDYDLTLASVLSDLYELIGKPVIERLRELKVPEKSQVWWCPTGAFCSLPLHAMGPIPSDDGNDLYFSDLYIPSYTPTLSALIESRERRSLSDGFDNSKPSILLVAQPDSDTLFGAFGEITVIESTNASVTTLISAMATPETVIEGLKDHRFAHFVCHGLLGEEGKPFDASLQLHKDNLTLLAIVRSQLPAAEFAFLAACHTAELTEDSVADEGLHLAAAMQFCGFRSVVGTMWAMADMDGADISKYFYKTIFSDNADQNGVPYHERSAQALQISVKKLRRKRGITLERWVNFVHYGA